MSMLEIELAAQLEKVRAERDALAAHVSVLESIINGSDLTDRTEVMSALNSTPAASLARLKAQWQAEEPFAKWLEEELKHDQLYINFSALLRLYRQQAEEAQ